MEIGKVVGTPQNSEKNYDYQSWYVKIQKNKGDAGHNLPSEPDYVVPLVERSEASKMDLWLKSKVLAVQDNDEVVIQQFEQIRRGGPMIRIQNQRK